MFLKTVPPAVAIHSEWRSSKSCSLPLFFNDSASDSDLASVNGTPIPQKIQMIIESLHSTQSSDMTDNGQEAHSSHEAGCKGQARSRRMDARRQNAGEDAGEDSDSDDSVDRGIEEAIQEYLKDKVDHKRKGDPVTGSPPAAKLQRREPSTPDVAKQHTHSSGGKVLTASNHIQRASTQPLKKTVKKKRISKENPFKKAEVSKSLPVKSLPLNRCIKGSTSSSEMDRSPPRLIIKEELLDSSSDDGIEEEIQRFQQEKKVTQVSEKDTPRRPQRTEDSDSSSDEGIEEAIRSFQAEKHKNNTNLLKPAQPVPVQRIVGALKPLSKKNNKKKLTSKKTDHPASLTISHFLNKCSSQGSKVKALGAPPTSPRTTDTEHQIHSSLNVNTADLMCAEAILDISKTVMPEVFESNFNTNTHQTFATTDDKSNDSSGDSEDGIEQEIRKFLELKAQMNIEPPLRSEDPAAGKEAKKKQKETQSSKIRLSLSRKRKVKEEQSKPSTDGDVACDAKEEPLGKTLVRSELTRSQISSPGISAPLTVKNNKPKQNSPARKVPRGTVPVDKCSPNSSRSVIGSERNDSGGKSSSLDSDEDLDAAIKDLLKTKKKVKKKVRDLRARKRLSEALTTDLKKTKLTAEQKNTPHVKTLGSTLQAKSNKDPRSKAGKSKSEAQNCNQPGLGNDGVEKECHQECVLPSSIPQASDDDSCVDSDDSIEQEIRRFLAERAKVAPPAHANVKQEAVEEEFLATDADVKQEHHQIPIETSRLQNNETQTEVQCGGSSLFVKRQTDSPAEADKGPVLTAGSSCIKGFWKTESANLEISDTREQQNGLSGKSTPTAMKSILFNSSSETQHASDQHQNLFLMATGNSKMNELTECPSTKFNMHLTSRQSRPAPRIPLSEVIKSVCSSPFSKTQPPESLPSTESPATTTGDISSSTTPSSRTGEIYLHHHMNRGKKDKLHQPSPALHPNQTPFPSFPPQKTEHPPVIKNKPSECRVSLGKEQRQGGDKKEEKEQDGGMKEDEEKKCLDETDVESDVDREGEKMKAGRQHQPSQSLSTSIDPGVLLSPYIALDTDERSRRFTSRRLQIQKQLKYSTTVKRRLRFVVSLPR